jgi:hypothetical protein
MNRRLTLFAVVIALGVNSNCGYKNNMSSGGGPNSATITNLVSSVGVGASYMFTATIPNTNGYTAGISWSISPAMGAGTLASVTNSGFSSSVVYMAPASAPMPNSVTITATPTDTVVGVATDTFTIGNSTTPYSSMLSGRYAFEVMGFDANGEPSSIVGTITSDGSGKITAGALDMNQGGAATVHSTLLGGTYTLGNTFRGTLTLSAGVSATAQPMRFAISLASDGKTGVLEGEDSGGFQMMNGTLQLQDSSAFSLAKISSEFAFKLESNSNERVATVGEFAIGANSNIAGLADSSQSGAGPVLTSAGVAGRVTAPPDTNGRGTLSLGMGGATAQLVYYVVSSQTVFLMESVSAGGAAHLTGIAERQALPFSAATANASSTFSASGFDAQVSTPGPVSVTGSLVIQNLTHAELSWSASSARPTQPSMSLRSDLVTFDPSTGRGTIQIANGYSNNFADSVAFYLAAPGEGFLLDTTAGKFNRAIVGDLDAGGAN